MMCFKTSFGKLLACTIIAIFMIDMYVINGINVYMNGNITAVSGEGGIEIKCSYTKQNVKTIFTVGIFSQNKTANDDFVSIVTFLPDDATVINHAGENLRGRIAMTNITQESTEATFIFNEIRCTDQNQYKCKVTYLNTNSDADSEMSLPTTINVTAKPQKPHISSDTSQQNQNLGKRRILQSEVLNRTSLYQTTIATDPDISSLLPYRAISEKKQFLREGDNITFVCSGNVGRPPGNILWQTIYTNENISFNYVNGSMETGPFHWKCSLNRTSYFIIQLSTKYFNARIRCFVVSHDGNNRTYEETEPLNFNFGVRQVSIHKLPDKQIYDTTIKNITLTCNGDGNPKPTYAWYRQKNTNTILSTSNKYVITNVIKNNSGTYICEVNNSISGETYNASTSVEITIEKINDSSEHKNNNSGVVIRLLIGGCIGLVFIAIISVCVLAIYKRGVRSKRQENKENEIRIPNNQTNNESASNAYVTVSSDHHAGKETNIDSQEMIKLSTIDERKTPSTTALSEYTKENMNEILKYRNENTCDNSLDHYASSVPDIYDELHDNRHKTDKGEKFDRMFQLKSLPENRNESNKSIENQDITILGSHPIHLENSRQVGYASVVIDDDKPVLSSEINEYGHDEHQTIRQHNKEYMHNQKQEEEKTNKSSIKQQTVEYAQVNEASKLKNKTRNKHTDQTSVDASAGTQEWINVKSEDRPPDKTDHFNIPKKQQTNGDTESSFIYNQTGSHINQAFESEEYQEVDSVFPPFCSLDGVQDDGQVHQNSEQ